MIPTTATCTKVKPNWYKLRTPQGLFFGYSRQQVIEKAAAAARDARRAP